MKNFFGVKKKIKMNGKLRAKEGHASQFFLSNKPNSFAILTSILN